MNYVNFGELSGQIAIFCCISIRNPNSSAGRMDQDIVFKSPLEDASHFLKSNEILTCSSNGRIKTPSLLLASLPVEGGGVKL